MRSIRLLLVRLLNKMTNNERVKRVAEMLYVHAIKIYNAMRVGMSVEQIIQEASRDAIAASDATFEVTWAMREVAARKLEETFDDVCHSDALDIVGDILQAALAAMRGETK